MHTSKTCITLIIYETKLQKIHNVGYIKSKYKSIISYKNKHDRGFIKKLHRELNLAYLLNKFHIMDVYE